jgi:predicted DNA-binding transcriptional regulator AlpA
MPKKNHKNEAISSAKTLESRLLSGRRSGSEISGNAQPWAADRDLTARRARDLLCATALPDLAGVAAGVRSPALQKHENSDPLQAPKPDGYDFIPGPKLRAKLGISAVTLWRWRHDKKNSFPAPKVINGRLYFPVTAVSAWIARQADAL